RGLHHPAHQDGVLDRVPVVGHLAVRQLLRVVERVDIGVAGVAELPGEAVPRASGAARQLLHVAEQRRQQGRGDARADERRIPVPHYRAPAPLLMPAFLSAYSALPTRFLRRCRRDTVVHTSDAGKIISPLPTAMPAWAVVAVGALMVLPPKTPPPPLQ